MIWDRETEIPDNAWQTHDIRREGQPISTDGFLRKVENVYSLSDMTHIEYAKRIRRWLCGYFTEAMEGME